MVAVVTGNGLGLFNASNNILGLDIGQSAFGRAGSNIFVNGATGNVLVQARDVYLSGRGADLFDLRTYNSRGAIASTIGDELGAGWARDGERRLVFSGGTPGSSGTVTRTLGDGS